MLTIRLLGQPEISRNEQPLRLPRRKSRALTYYLAASPQPVRREQLLDLFWIDLPRQSARQVLRTTLSEMRKTLGDALLSEDENVAIRAEAWVDAREFSAALSAREPGGDLSMTLDLYRGEFLAGFSLNDAPEYETWLLTERERYHRLLVRGLTLLSRRARQPAILPARWRRSTARWRPTCCKKTCSARPSAWLTWPATARTPSAAMTSSAACWMKKWASRPWPRRVRSTTPSSPTGWLPPRPAACPRPPRLTGASPPARFHLPGAPPSCKPWKKLPPGSAWRCWKASRASARPAWRASFCAWPPAWR
jgi:hypothetical protein